MLAVITMIDDPSTSKLAELRRSRRRGLLNHFLAFLAVLVVLVPVNYALAPAKPIFLWVMVGWGAPLALHVAMVMELFGPPKV